MDVHTQVVEVVAVGRPGNGAEVAETPPYNYRKDGKTVVIAACRGARSAWCWRRVGAMVTGCHALFGSYAWQGTHPIPVSTTPLTNPIVRVLAIAHAATSRHGEQRHKDHGSEYNRDESRQHEYQWYG